MTVLGDLDRLAGDNASQDGARLLPKLSYAYTGTHGVYTVAPSLGLVGVGSRDHHAGVENDSQSGAQAPSASLRSARSAPAWWMSNASRRPDEPEPMNASRATLEGHGIAASLWQEFLDDELEGLAEQAQDEGRVKPGQPRLEWPADRTA